MKYSFTPTGAPKLLVIVLPLILLLTSVQAASEVDSELPESVLKKVEQTVRGTETSKQTSNSKDGNTKISFKNANKLSKGLLNSLSRSPNVESFAVQPFLRLNDSGRIQITISLSDSSSNSITALKDTGFQLEVINQRLNAVQGWATPKQIEEIVTLPFVESANAPKYAQSRSGSTQTEGDAILKSNLVRATGLTGKNIKVGIISDGGNNAADAQASGDLPATVTFFGSCSNSVEDISNCRRASSCNEGTAMAEIIHDIAPDAELAIAAVSTDLEFLQRLDQLANEFGADIIVDDLGFFGEPFFSDGPLAQAVSALPDNILYVSSAGNSGNSHYENDFVLGSNQVLRPHQFSSNGDNNNGFIIPPRSFVVPILQWNDSFDNPTSDYDLIVTSLTEVVGRSEADQSMPGIAPFEALCIPNTSSSNVTNFALINQFSGTSKRLEMFFLGSPAIEFSVPSGSIFGHPGVPRALAIATINASEPGNDEIAFYSSQGPSRIDLPNREDRAKPDLTGIDGVSVTGAGGFFSPFFGTSAAAPHVAGVAALLMSRSKNVTAKNVRTALEESAVDLGAAGRDSVFGAGRVYAQQAQSILRIGIPLPPFIILLDED